MARRRGPSLLIPVLAVISPWPKVPKRPRHSTSSWQHADESLGKEGVSYIRLNL